MYLEHKMTYIEKIVNVETGEETTRQYTAAEIAQVEARRDELQIEIELEATKATEKAALLERLGLTQDEAKLLLS
jgi:hypothetical protein